VFSKNRCSSREPGRMKRHAVRDDIEPFMASSGIAITDMITSPTTGWTAHHSWNDEPCRPQIPPYQLHAGKQEDKVVIELIPVNFKPLV